MASQQKLATKDPNKATEAEARQWYANYNKDGKGDVDINDLIKFHEESYRDEENPEEGLKEGQRQAVRFLKAYDTNKDGKITLEEYLAVLRKINIID